MLVVRRLFDFYINSSIHVSLAVYALVRISLWKFELEYSHTIGYFLFFGTITGYNYVKYAGVAKLYHRRLTKSMRVIQIFSLICFGLFIFYGAQLSTKVLMYSIPFSVLTILYALPVLPNNKNLRSLSGIKVFVISLVWSGVTVLLPAVHYDMPISFDIIIECIQRFLFAVILMLPFEIRDLKYDSATLYTIPQQLGVTKTKVFGSVLLVIFVIITGLKDNLTVVEILSTICIAIITLLFLWMTEKNQSKYFSSFWVESIPIVWMFIYYIMSISI